MHHLMIGLVVLFPVIVFAQEKPPKPITVTVSTARHLHFGTFIKVLSGSGTVNVGPTGNRTSLNVILPSISKDPSPTASLFIVTALPGTLINISTNTPQDLTGIDGSKMQLNINLMYDCDKGSSFIATSDITDVSIGGTLTVNSNNGPGPYGGSFSVTFIQQ